MGSLPNLHELGRDGFEAPATFRPGPALGHLCGGANPALTQAEKSKILHRYSGHARITKARSNGHDPNKIVYDDFMLEHMAAYSPISNRSTRNMIRRRDSINSSIGATSVRRLIAVVRSTQVRSDPQRQGHRQNRRLLLANLIVLCVAHLIITAAFLPFLALQTSVSVWTTPLGHFFTPFNINVGSLSMALVFVFAALAALLGPSLVQKLGTNAVFVSTYLILTLFYASHLYPSLYVLLPLSVILGLALGPLASAQITFLMTLSIKISYMFSEEDEDSKALRRTCIIRRLARAFQAAHDFGLILGSVLSALLITYTVSINNQQHENSLNSTLVLVVRNHSTCANFSLDISNCTRDDPMSSPGLTVYDYNAFLDDIFDTYEGTRLCGAQACPPSFLLDFNVSEEVHFHVVPKNTSKALAVVYAGLCFVAALISAAGLDRIRTYVYQDPLERPEGLAALRAVRESFRDVRLQMAAPLALFIGFEQAFMYADFGKSYVVCTLGIHRLNLIFLAMGLLQSIAACTLSMLLRTIRRYYVVAVGFTFHACLLMVLVLWKPIEDDPALFYVISAAWGVCNAIWEMLNFTLLTGLYSDNWESAFANSAFFRFLGLSIAFAFHGLLCNLYKLYALGFFLLAAVVPFAWLEIRLENMRKVKNIIRL